MNVRESIEHFHLCFSRRLAAKIDPRLFALKGGCNLRFYFHSYRYSEDIDFDAKTVAVPTLKKGVENILSDKTFEILLRHKNIEIVGWSSAKQTETTQRWKVTLRHGSLGIPTKIEFSRRNADFRGAAMEPVDPTLVTFHQTQPIVLQHYLPPAATIQKISALINRSETQARDVVDLKILKDILPQDHRVSLTEVDKRRALEVLSGVSFEDFLSQVWPYLLDEFQEPYKNERLWRDLHHEVFEFIESLPEMS